MSSVTCTACEYASKTFIFSLCYKTKSPEEAGPHLHSHSRERCVFWVWAKHSIWQFIEELHLPKCSEAEVPVGQGSVVLRRGNCRLTQRITELSVATFHSRALPAAHDPSTHSSAQQSKKTGNVPLLAEWVALRTAWYQTVRFCDTKLQLQGHTNRTWCFPALPTVLFHLFTISLWAVGERRSLLCSFYALLKLWPGVQDITKIEARVANFQPQRGRILPYSWLNTPPTPKPNTPPPKKKTNKLNRTKPNESTKNYFKK